MKVIVCGGRDYDDYFTVDTTLRQIYSDYCFTTIVEGGAKGADFLAKKWALENNFPLEEYTADWKKYGKAGGIIRNQEMLEESGATLVVAFPGGTGTYDMIKRARNKPGVDVIVINEGQKYIQASLELRPSNPQLSLDL